MGYYTLDAVIEDNNRVREKVRILHISDSGTLHCITEIGDRVNLKIRDNNESGVKIESLTLTKPSEIKSGIHDTYYINESTPDTPPNQTDGQGVTSITKLTSSNSRPYILVIIKQFLSEIKSGIHDTYYINESTSDTPPISRESLVIYLELEPLPPPWERFAGKLIDVTFFNNNALMLKTESRKGNISNVVERFTNFEYFIKEIFTYDLDTSVTKILPFTRDVKNQQRAIKVIQDIFGYQKIVDPPGCTDPTQNMPWGGSYTSRSGGSVVNTGWMKKVAARKCLTQYTGRKKEFFFKEFSGAKDE